jgi:hypothetical protein
MSETKSTLGPLRISLYIYEFLIKPATVPAQKQTQRTDRNDLGTQWARSRASNPPLAMGHDQHQGEHGNGNDARKQ